MKYFSWSIENKSEEKEILDPFERGEWKSVSGQETEVKRFEQYAKATFRKDRKVNIRVSRKVLEAIQKRALEEGIPYQTLISSVLHKYISGKLVEKKV